MLFLIVKFLFQEFLFMVKLLCTELQMPIIFSFFNDFHLICILGLVFRFQLNNYLISTVYLLEGNLEVINCHGLTR